MRVIAPVLLIPLEDERVGARLSPGIEEGDRTQHEVFGHGT